MSMPPQFQHLLKKDNHKPPRWFQVLDSSNLPMNANFDGQILGFVRELPDLGQFTLKNPNHSGLVSFDYANVVEVFSTKVEIATAPNVVLDWLVGELEKEPIEVRDGDIRYKHAQFSDGGLYCPSTSPDQGHQLLEDNNVNCIRVSLRPFEYTWAAMVDIGQQSMNHYELMDAEEFYVFPKKDLVTGETMLIAGLRAYLISVHGQEAEVPPQIMELAK